MIAAGDAGIVPYSSWGKIFHLLSRSKMPTSEFQLQPLIYAIHLFRSFGPNAITP